MSVRPPRRVEASARGAAAAIVASVLDQGMLLDDVFHECVDGLDARDRAFARLLATTTLRRLGQIDDLLNRFLSKPVGTKARFVMHALRLGAAQWLFLDTPAHAAVNHSVELVGRNRAYRGLANAVLRRIVREGKLIVENQDTERLNMPDWMWSRLNADYGETLTRAMARAHMAEPPLDLSVKDDPQACAEAVDGEVLPWNSVRRWGGGSVADLPGYAEGHWWVQDAAAALPARLMISALAGDTTGRIADLCAAPGGKTAQLAHAGFRVSAVDRSAKRLQRLNDNMARLGFAVETVASDIRKWQPGSRFDGVLLDAPCTASGTLRRHPDAAFVKRAQDVDSLAGVQSALLGRAVDMLQPGGILVYCTCSLFHHEGERQIEALLDNDNRLQRVPVTAPEVGGVEELINRHGDLRTLPCHLPDAGGLDGFYAARLRRMA